MKRKTLMAIIAIVTAIAATLQSQLGLSIGFTAAIGGIGIALLYIFFEAKRDIMAISQQHAKWVDPKFWTALIAAILAVVNEQFGLHLPAPAIIAVLALIMSILFKAKVATT